MFAWCVVLRAAWSVGVRSVGVHMHVFFRAGTPTPRPTATPAPAPSYEDVSLTSASWITYCGGQTWTYGYDLEGASVIRCYSANLLTLAANSGATTRAPRRARAVSFLLSLSLSARCLSLTLSL